MIGDDMANERLNFNLENKSQYLSENDGYFFDEIGYKRNLSGLETEKQSTKKEAGVKVRRLVDKLFGRKSTNTLSDNKIWENIERYLQEFKDNPDLFELQDIRQQNFLDKIKNSKDRLEEPLIYKAAAFLLANFEIGGSPYRSLAGYENRGQWVKILLGKAHYNQFLLDKAACIRDRDLAENSKGLGLDKKGLNEQLATCEMDYLVNNIRGSNGKFSRYFGYHPSKGRGRLSNEFADRLSGLSEGWFTASNIEESCSNIAHNDFNQAKADFVRFITSSRTPNAIANLKKMFKEAKTEGQLLESQKYFLICMLSGILDINGTKDVREQVYSWAKTLGFLPGMLVEDAGHSEQVILLLDDFSKGDFSKHVKSAFHTNNLSKGRTNIGDLINEINSRWSVDMMHKFEQYSKSDFPTRQFPSRSALEKLQKLALSDSVDVDSALRS